MEKLTGTSSAPPMKKKMRTITIEEAYASPSFMNGPGRALKEQAAGLGYSKIIDQLCDIGEGRIADMDAAGIDVQVLSLTSPGTEQMEASESVALAHEANDAIAEAVRLHPDRYAGFAALPTTVPDAAANELERMVKEHGFKGALINGHIKGRYLDDEFFWPIFERAEELQVPIYIHPTPPPKAVIFASYAGNYPPEITGLLATGAWGWHIETAVHILRIILSGAFDRCPKLQLVIGHMGEGLPFMMSRIEDSFNLGWPSNVKKLERPIGAYFRENVNYTFSGFNYTPTFLDLMFQVGVERILFSADYPYGSMVQAREFLDRLPVSPADRERIAHGNAERLLRM
jgi:uncharacterized protein